MMQTLIDKIEELMLEDEEDREAQSEILIDLYKKCPFYQRKVIDMAFITLCGYSLKSLIK